MFFLTCHDINNIVTNIFGFEYLILTVENEKVSFCFGNSHFKRLGTLQACFADLNV